ncbi:MAG: M18 family aminopeptidase [Pseudomonadota bacterium]|nr:MAG: M18 family aminopeptidase [Pseudomonadota bacterium]
MHSQEAPDVARDAARDLLSFIDRSPSPYHAVGEVVSRLQAGGFRAFDERDGWEMAPGTRGYVVRGGSVIAFVLGMHPPAQTGFRLIGAHTDSPNLRVKPAARFDNVGYAQLSVEVYGGVLLGTWLDRDLSIAGRLVLADGSEMLVRLPEATCRVPSLAIHLNREVNKEGLTLNTQQHLAPVLGLEHENPPELIERLLAARGVSDVRPEDVLGFDLCLFDVTPGAIGGANGEFLFSARLDNLASCHAATAALLRATRPVEHTRVVALYDHEEVGSQSATGARSAFLEQVLERLALAAPDAPRDAKARAFARSLLVSADMAHAVHPNYADKHDKQHRPLLGKGPVIKFNVNQSYATEASGAAAFVAACRAEGLSPQRFVSRNDMPCGSTIGPISAARLGIRTVDVGNPMLSMHSCREMAAVADVEPMIRVLGRLLD